MNKMPDNHSYWQMGFLIFILFLGNVSRGLAQDDTAGFQPPRQTVAGSNANEAQAEREDFVKEIRRVEQLNKKYTKEIEDIRTLLTDKDADYQKRRLLKRRWPKSKVSRQL